MSVNLNKLASVIQYHERAADLHEDDDPQLARTHAMTAKMLRAVHEQAATAFAQHERLKELHSHAA